MGSLWCAELAYTMFLSLAGAFIYFSLFIYAFMGKQTGADVLMLGIFVGLLAVFLTGLLVSLGGGENLIWKLT